MYKKNFCSAEINELSFYHFSSYLYLPTFYISLQSEWMDNKKGESNKSKKKKEAQRKLEQFLQKM